MRTLRRLVILCAVLAIVAGAFSWYSPEAVARIGDAIRQAITATATASPSPADSAPSTTAMVDPKPTDPPAAASTGPAGPMTPSPTDVPTALATPTDQTARSSPWSAEECAWVISTLELDASLDQAEADRIRAGEDARYAGMASTYDGYVQQWRTAEMQARAICADPPRLPSDDIPFFADDCGMATEWFSEAVAAHQADTARHPANQPWNDTWIANYQRLTSLWQRACP